MRWCSRMPVERELRFTAEQIERFAAASGDRNPLHVDPEFAAGTAFGSPIVHGSLIALAMLGAIPDEHLALIRTLRISFSGAMPRGTEASLRAEALEREEGAWEVRLAARGKTIARILARTSKVEIQSPDGIEGEPIPMRETPAEPSSAELSEGHSLRGSYASRLGLDDLARGLGAGAIDSRLLEGLAWASYVVGMELPGLHSLFAGVTLVASDEQHEDASGYRLTLRDHDERTGQLAIEGALGAVRGGVLAAIQCFALPATASPDPATLGFDRPAEADRGTVVVAGGSRGFGASLTLALLALGYEVHVAYAKSQERARELARLAGAHRARLHLTQLDVSDPDAVQALAQTLREEAGSLVGLVLNAALPPLAMSLTASSAAELADYVAASLRLAAVPLGALLPTIEGGGGWVLFCSSAAVAAPPRDWPHYVAAKGALEGLAGWVAATKPELRTVIVRPPKMQTAMTGTPSGRLGAASADAIALWTAERLAGGELEPGLSTLEPDSHEVATA
jgi:NAD(P)-dependent dehydrogenase (short-subunit alcohol dehydrogenase family)/acyl dehydratase